MKKTIDFTIIMPVSHGGHFLRMALSSIRRLDYPSDRMEVLVAGTEKHALSRGIVRDEALLSGYEIFHARSLGVHRLPHMILMFFAAGLCALLLLSAVYQPMKMLLWIVLGAYLTVLLIKCILDLYDK